MKFAYCTDVMMAIADKCVISHETAPAYKDLCVGGLWLNYKEEMQAFQDEAYDLRHWCQSTLNKSTEKRSLK